MQQDYGCGQYQVVQQNHGDNGIRVKPQNPGFPTFKVLAAIVTVGLIVAAGVLFGIEMAGIVAGVALAILVIGLASKTLLANKGTSNNQVHRTDTITHATIADDDNEEYFSTDRIQQPQHGTPDPFKHKKLPKQILPFSIYSSDY